MSKKKDLPEINTPIDVERYEELLRVSGFDQRKSKYLIDGFKKGFDIGYRGPESRQDVSNNIPISVGSIEEMWDKVMKEVNLKRYSGPYDEVPFVNFMQSPKGLVPKAGNQTRLIFNLSYDFGKDKSSKSLNYHTPEELCSVKYHDLDYAFKTCLSLKEKIIAGYHREEEGESILDER